MSVSDPGLAGKADGIDTGLVGGMNVSAAVGKKLLSVLVASESGLATPVFRSRGLVGNALGLKQASLSAGFGKWPASDVSGMFDRPECSFERSDTGLSCFWGDKVPLDTGN